MNKLICILLFSLSIIGCSEDKTQLNISNDQLYFISPADGDTLKSPITVRFGLNGMGVAPAGTIKDNTGHHHLIIDAPLPDLKRPIPNDDNYIHFGDGQTETTIHLKPGVHTLQLLLGDGYHIPHSEPLISKKITITIVK